MPHIAINHTSYPRIITRKSVFKETLIKSSAEVAPSDF